MITEEKRVRYIDQRKVASIRLRLEEYEIARTNEDMDNAT